MVEIKDEISKLKALQKEIEYKGVVDKEGFRAICHVFVFGGSC